MAKLVNAELGLYKCAKCGREDTIDNFRMVKEYWRDDAKEKVRPEECKECYNKYQREYSKILRKKKREQWFSGLSCVVCGEDSKPALDFHHIDPEKKERAISSMLKHSDKSIQHEMDKCVVLCANCHRKLHAGLSDIVTIMQNI